MADGQYSCGECGWLYDESQGDGAGVAAGTAFADVADDWECPICSARKDMFGPITANVE